MATTVGDKGLTLQKCLWTFSNVLAATWSASQAGQHHKLVSITSWSASQPGQHHNLVSITSWSASQAGQHHKLVSITRLHSC